MLFADQSSVLFCIIKYSLNKVEVEVVNCHVRLVFVNELAVIVDFFPFYTSMDD